MGKYRNSLGCVSGSALDTSLGISILSRVLYIRILYKESNGSNTEATLILCGYSGERANNRGDSTIKEEDEEKKN